ncbi:MAG: pyridoxal phosphate-dependent class II aminotransferase [Clostridiales bacterium]|nr:pyridoxal phosphate-dependent class II aminotransferase [Clostridiales bacterium]
MKEYKHQMLPEHGGNRYRAGVRYDFSANINPLGMPEPAKKAFAGMADMLEYYPDPDCTLLREAIGEWEKVPAEWILTGNGAVELIYGLVYAVKPKKALLVEPSFSEYEKALRNVDCEICYYKLDKSDGFQVNEEILNSVTTDLDLVFLCNPNNPTGQTIARECMYDILKRCEQNQTLLVVDECFLPFLSTEEERTLKPYLLTHSCLAVLRAYTKLFAMPGVRLGYLLSGNPVLLKKIRNVLPEWSTSQVAQIVGREAAKDTGYLFRTRNLIDKERLFLREELKDNPLIDCLYGSEANFLFFRGDTMLYEKLLQQGILIRDCSNFLSLKKGYYRIAVRTHEENIKLVNGMKRLAEKARDQEETWQK